jgi:hypothetical protein
MGADADEARRRADWVRLLESFDEHERWTSIALVAGQHVAFDETERNEALRRALVVRAVGGDPHRELELDEDAVTRLADELDDPERRAQLRAGLVALAPPSEAVAVADTIGRLVESPDLAWRAFCAALLADELLDE